MYRTSLLEQDNIFINPDVELEQKIKAEEKILRGDRKKMLDMQRSMEDGQYYKGTGVFDHSIQKKNDPK
jgi:hypothetical protein